MTANEFCSLQICRNIGCGKLNRDKDTCTNVQPPRKPGEVRRGTECNSQMPRWSIKDCRAKKCEYLKNTTGYPDAQERCHVLGEDCTIMPGTLTHCIQDLDHQSPEEFLRQVSGALYVTWETEGCYNRKNPGPKNCPAACPYKISAVEEAAGKDGKKPKTVWRCAFSGAVLGAGMGGACHCHVLDNTEQEAQIRILQEIVDAASRPASGHLKCGGEFCPDGVKRCGIGETICQLVKVPLAAMKVCPLWRIPAKLLPETPKATKCEYGDCPVWHGQCSFDHTPTATCRKEMAADYVKGCTDDIDEYSCKVDCEAFPECARAQKCMSCDHLKDCDIRSGTDGCTVEYESAKAEEAIPESPALELQEEKPANSKEPELPTKKRPKKEKTDPVCEHCRERMKGNVPAHACGWCKEEQQKNGRRAWVTDIKLGSVLLGDMNEIGKRVPADSVDVIFTDPVYLKEHYQQAYADLAELALRVLKPHGFLFTYAPQTHLDEIMDLLRFTGTWRYGGKLQYFWVIESLNGGQSTAKNHQRNAICLHKPILVFQKAPEGVQLKGARRCFADVVRGYRQKRFHPWQQSVHDVLGIIDRFMQPGEILLDPFAGTGTSLIAGQLLGMEVVGFEMDPNTHAIAVREMQQRPLGLVEEDLSPDVEREAVQEPKDTSKQAGIEEPEKSSRTRSRIDKPPSGIKKEPAPPAPETPKSGGPTPGTCGTCGHHKGRKTFHESCPRLGELLFKGGTKSAKVLMQETEKDRCEHWTGPIPYEQKTAKPEPKKKPTPKPYTIYIKRSDGKHPFIVSCDSQGHGGTSNPCDTQEEVVKRALVTLDGFVHDIKKSTLQKKPLPVTSETTLFIDKTGLFKVGDFFDENGLPKKPEPKPANKKPMDPSCKNCRVLDLCKFKNKPHPGCAQESEKSPTKKKGRNPSINACKGHCPYGLIIKENNGSEKHYPQGRCAFTGDKFKDMIYGCPLGLLEKTTEATLRMVDVEHAVKRLSAHQQPAETCQCDSCPDGIIRCEQGAAACPVNQIPFAELIECPQFRIPKGMFEKAKEQTS